jgi:hypothetical protein
MPSNLKSYNNYCIFIIKKDKHLQQIATSYLYKNFNINVKNPLEVCALINLDIKPTL